MSESELITPREAATRLGASPRTILRLLREHRVPSYRLGRKTIRVSWAEVIQRIRQDGAMSPTTVVQP
jgi:excisionase family DNA binding protein